MCTVNVQTVLRNNICDNSYFQYVLFHLYSRYATLSRLRLCVCRHVAGNDVMLRTNQDSILPACVRVAGGAGSWCAGERVADTSSDITPLLLAAPSIASDEYWAALAAMAASSGSSTTDQQEGSPEVLLPPARDAADVLHDWLDALPPAQGMQEDLLITDDNFLEEFSSGEPGDGDLTTPPLPGAPRVQDDQCSTDPDFFQVGEGDTPPTHTQFNWWNVLNRLTQDQLDELNRTTVDLTLTDPRYDPDEVVAPPQASGPPPRGK